MPFSLAFFLSLSCCGLSILIFLSFLFSIFLTFYSFSSQIYLLLSHCTTYINAYLTLFPSFHRSFFACFFNSLFFILMSIPCLFHPFFTLLSFFPLFFHHSLYFCLFLLFCGIISIHPFLYPPFSPFFFFLPLHHSFFPFFVCYFFLSFFCLCILVSFRHSYHFNLFDSYLCFLFHFHHFSSSLSHVWLL